MNAITSNPNASVATLAGSLTVVLVWMVGVVGLKVPAEVASALTTIMTAAILYFGRRTKAAPSSVTADATA